MATNIVKATEIAQAYHYPQNHLNKREQKVLEISDQYAPAVPANWSSPVPATIDAALDQLALAGPAAQYGMATASVEWDFSVNGGAVSSIPLGITLPDNAIIQETIADILVAVTGAGTVQLSVPVDGALQTGTTDSADAIAPQDVSLAAPKKLTAARIIQVTIAGAVVTAGKVRYYVRYFKGE